MKGRSSCVYPKPIGPYTASYKFALASALLEMRPQAGQLIKLDELAPAFALSIAKHLATSPKQITTAKGRRFFCIAPAVGETEGWLVT